VRKIVGISFGQRGFWRVLTSGIAAVVVLLAFASARTKASGQSNTFTSHNVTTYHYDNSRTGQNINETILTTSNVNTLHFGKLFTVHVDGYVYAQPLYLSAVSFPGKGTHNVVYVATEHDSVSAVDADSGKLLWRKSFINPVSGITTVSSNDVGCLDLTPEIGITSTPVIDTSTSTIYVVVETKERTGFFQRIHALDVTTGAEKSGSPVVIQATVPGSGDGSMNGFIKFDPLRQNQRVSLLLQNGMLYIGWASHCDIGLYHAWVMAYNSGSLKQVAVWNSTPNGGLGGVWQAGAGLAGDSSFNTYFATGNGTFDVDQGGIDFGDSILKLAVPTSALFGVADYFTPYNQDYLNSTDLDLGSGGVLLLPDQPAGSPHQHLLVQAGKEGSIYLIDRDNMGHHNPDTVNPNKQIVQFLPYAVGGVWAMPAWWNNNVYFGGVGDVLKQFTFDPSTGLLSVSPISLGVSGFGYPGATPVVSANGSSNGIVWALQTDAFGYNGPAVLHAYDATNLGNELYNTSQNSQRDNPGAAVKFAVPIVANGKVYVGAQYQLSVYGPRH
jgi:hypothetical protein